jgi:hypothetical protein
MDNRKATAIIGAGSLIWPVILLTATHAAGQLNLGPEQCVQSDGLDIVVPGYSVPSFVYWDGDDRKDLIVGEGSGTETARVRIYLNVGTEDEPVFSGYFYAQSDGEDLTVPGGGCLGLFPRVVYWDGDDRKDLLVSQADGRFKLFLNIGTDDDPTFDGGTFLQVGAPGFKTDIDVGSRATLTVVDWNSDGRKDLVAGAVDGEIHIFLNEGTDVAPDFLEEILALNDGEVLVVPTLRSSPAVLDADGDGKKDLLTGNTYGALLLYVNTGTDEEPSFSGYVSVEADGVPIDLPGTPRSRPSICDWTGDGPADVLIGAGDGLVRLYQGVAVPGDTNGDGVVDIEDLLFLLGVWGECPDPPVLCPADFDGNGIVNVTDLLFLLAHWS